MIDIVTKQKVILKHRDGLSNRQFARLYRTQDTAAFQDAHTEFFHYCHGVYHTVVYDNMKVAVKKFVGHSEKEPTDALVELSNFLESRIYAAYRVYYCWGLHPQTPVN